MKIQILLFDGFDELDAIAPFEVLFDAGAIVASVCTGTMLLARAGLLAGRKATTHHQAVADLEAEV